MRHSLQVTEDGSHTVLDKLLNVAFHSRHGAIQESMHVFIEKGLLPILESRQQINILETGFGTGLNALLTMRVANQQKLSVHYTAYELFPLSEGIYKDLNYAKQLGLSHTDLLSLHEARWEDNIELSAFFSLNKVRANFNDITFDPAYDLIYLDAFAPGSQPEFWEPDFIDHLYQSLHPGGMIVSYCAKGSYKRALRSAGFDVESLPGPPGKREMTRATKLSKA